jgi:hypothetical protein
MSTSTKAPHSVHGDYVAVGGAPPAIGSAVEAQYRPPHERRPEESIPAEPIPGEPLAGEPLRAHDHEPAMSPGEAPQSPPRRRGDVSKCPICGSAIDADAFHCAACHNYFCFHCRARLLKSDTQLQCGDQNCDYYAKLICSVCDAPTVTEEPPSVFVEPLDGYWPLWLIVAILAGGLTWYNASFLAALFTAMALFVIGGYLLHRFAVNIFGGERRVIQQRTSTYHTCICCKQPVRELPQIA